MKKIVMLLALAGVAFLAFKYLKPKETLHPEEMANVVGIDVRSLQEVQDSPAPGSLHIPVGELSSKVAAQVADKNTPIALFCESGGRAGVAKATLVAMGYTNVKNIGSWREWNQSQNSK